MKDKIHHVDIMILFLERVRHTPEYDLLWGFFCCFSSAGRHTAMLTLLFAASVSTLPTVSVEYPGGAATGPADAFSVKVGGDVWFEMVANIFLINSLVTVDQENV